MTHYPNVDPNPNFPELEKRVLEYWQRENIFAESVEKRSAANEFVFYDGPPFANGLPHYGHLLTGYVKDAIARYQTMRGLRVERRFGWDCHGLPAEMGSEKELGISGRQAISNFGIGKFNEHCRTSVMKYTHEWENYVNRQARWVDFKNDYKTMDKNFMESVLWAFKQLYDKGLVYEAYRVMPYSWAAETPLSNFETKLDNSYREREDKAIYVAFELNNKFRVHDAWDKDAVFAKVQKWHVIAWTTTPWTLPSNLALAVNKEISYTIVHKDNKGYVVAEQFSQKLIEILGEGAERTDSFDGNYLIGLTYKPLFPYFADRAKLQGDPAQPNGSQDKGAFRILDGSSFVTDGDGTGIVHMAPGFGEDDQKCCEANGIELVVPVDGQGKYTDEIFDISMPTAEENNLPPPAGGGRRGVSIHEENAGGMAQGVGNTAFTTRNSEAIENAKELRKNQTDAEVKLWWALRQKQLENYKFRRQQPVGNYIVDFICMDKKLIIELDGSQHNEDDTRRYDEKRTAYLESGGYKVLRFWNNEVFENLDGIAEMILRSLDPSLFPNASVGMDTPLPTSPRKREEEFLRLKGLNVIAEKNKEESDPFNEKQIEKFGLVNLRIINYLKQTGQLIKQEEIKHNYPHCWRTDTPLIYRAMPSWYVEVTKFRDRAVELNKQINWIPDHIRDGQMGHMLATAPDWSISRNRFWGTPIPIWRSKSGEIIAIGSIEELEKLSGKKITDLHRPYIDDITITKDGEEYTRVEDVFDCWFESGSMPFAQVHYPFENKDWFESHFPADFITEYVGQTRGWFNTLIMLSTALFDCPPFKNCICHGVVLDSETGLKYSKRLKNYKDPMEVMDKFGSDALRWLMLASPVMRGHDLSVDPDGKFIRDVVRLAIKPIWNAYNFFSMYANADNISCGVRSTSTGSHATQKDPAQPLRGSQDLHIMDRYILAKCGQAVSTIQNSMDAYDAPGACDAVIQFFEVLNNWYIRRSKERFWKEEKDADKQAAYDTLYTVLTTMCAAAAPLLPLTTEEIYRGLTGEKSVHLASFPSTSSCGAQSASAGYHAIEKDSAPSPRDEQNDDELIAQMDFVQSICNAALAIRSKLNIRVRQPLANMQIIIKNVNSGLDMKLAPIVGDEVNVKKIMPSYDFDDYATLKLSINSQILGKRLPEKMKQILPASKKGEWKPLANGGVEICGETLLVGEYTLNLEPKPEYKDSAQALSTNDALVILDTTVTPELEAEGLARDLVRLIQQARKDAGLHVSDRIELSIAGDNALVSAAASHADYISEQTLSNGNINQIASNDWYKVEKSVDDLNVTIALKKAA